MSFRLSVSSAFAVATIAAATLGTAPVQAGVAVGDTVTCTSLGGFDCSAASAVVGAGSEFAIGGGFFSIDFSTNQLTVLANQSGTLGATVIQFGNLSNPFTNFAFVGQTGFVGLDAGDITLVGNQLQIDFRGTCNACGGQITTGDVLTISFDAGAVPEPATWAMLILGFGAVGASLRRRRSALTYAFS